MQVCRKSCTACPPSLHPDCPMQAVFVSPAWIVCPWLLPCLQSPHESQRAICPLPLWGLWYDSLLDLTCCRTPQNVWFFGMLGLWSCTCHVWWFWGMSFRVLPTIETHFESRRRRTALWSGSFVCSQWMIYKEVWTLRQTKVPKCQIVCFIMVADQNPCFLNVYGRN